jgi:hypothetical protein
LIASIEGQIESELVHVKPYAAIQIAYEDRDRLHAQVGALRFLAQRGVF